MKFVLLNPEIDPACVSAATGRPLQLPHPPAAASAAAIAVTVAVAAAAAASIAVVVIAAAAAAAAGSYLCPTFVEEVLSSTNTWGTCRDFAIPGVQINHDEEKYFSTSSRSISPPPAFIF